MKKTLTVFALSTFMVTAVTPFAAYAIGIPTLDATTGFILTSNALAQAQQAVDALKTAKDGIQQVKQQYDNYKSIVTGNDKLGNFLNNPAINKVLPLGEWSDVYTSVQDIASLRERYGLKSDDLTVQAKFDRMMAAADALERNYNASTDRVKNAAELRAMLNEVQTPQQKEDLQLRFQQELIEQQNQQMRLVNIQMLQAQQEKMENQKKAQAFEDAMRKKG